MADHWLEISSAEYDSHCGDDGVHTVESALDGTSYWFHTELETHWLILDLSQTYTIKKVQGRSFIVYDPTNVNIYVSDSKDDWDDAVFSGNPGWEDNRDWVETDTTDKDGRYIKVEILATEEGISGTLTWGWDAFPFAIFDAYGDVYVLPVGKPGLNPGAMAKMMDVI